MCKLRHKMLNGLNLPHWRPALVKFQNLGHFNILFFTNSALWGGVIFYLFFVFFAQLPLVVGGGNVGDWEDSPQILLTAIIFYDKSRNLFKFVFVLLSASVQRVGVSRMRDFYFIFLKTYSLKCSKKNYTRAIGFWKVNI